MIALAPTIRTLIGFESIKRIAVARTNEVMRRTDIPMDDWVPEDLKEYKARFQGTSNGFRVAARIHPYEDLNNATPSPADPLLIGLIPAFAFITQLGGIGQLVGGAGLLFLAYLCQSLYGKGRMFLLMLIGAIMPLALVSGKVSFIPHLSAGGMMSRDGGVNTSAFLSILGPVGLLVGTLFFVLLASPHGEVKANLRLAFVILLGLAAFQFVDTLVSSALPMFANLLPWALGCTVAGVDAWLVVRSRAKALWVFDQMFPGEAPDMAAERRLKRQAQAVRAARDKTPLAELGTSMGIAALKGDGSCPDANRAFVISLQDLSRHLFIFGKTGTGKTSSALKPLAQSLLVFAKERLGAFVLDGKNDLAAEFEHFPEYTLITAQSQIGLIEGLLAEELVEATFNVADTQGKGHGENGQFWQDSARIMLLSVAVVLEALVEMRTKYEHTLPLAASDAARNINAQWHLNAIREVLNKAQNPTSAEFMKFLEVPAQFHPDRGNGGLLDDAITFFVEALPGMDERVRGSIFATVNALISPLFHHRELVHWAHETTGLDVSQVLRGKRMGLLLPEQTYGRAGLLVASLLKQRLYSAIRRRRKGWEKIPGETPCLFIFDECQNLVSQADLTLANMARSVGARLIMATQSLENLILRFGSLDAAKGFMNNFLSWMALDTSPATLVWCMEQLGQSYVRQKMVNRSAIDYSGTARLFAKSAFADPTHPYRAFYKHVMRDLMHEGMAAMQGDLNKQAAIGMQLPGLLTAVGSQMGPLFDPAEIAGYLDTEFTALCQINRGGAKRRDFIRLKPIFDFPTSTASADTDADAEDAESTDTEEQAA